MAEAEAAATSDVQQPKAKAGTRKRGRKKRAAKKTSKPRGRAAAKYPRHTVEKSLRIPRAILEQNAGKDCSESEAAKFLGLKTTGAFVVEISSGVKYGFLSRPSPGQIHLTDRAKKVIRPQKENDAVDGLRERCCRRRSSETCTVTIAARICRTHSSSTTR